MSFFDWFLIVVLAYSTIMAFVRGILLELFALGGLIAGILLACWNYGHVALLFGRLISTPAIAQIVAFALILASVMILSALLGLVGPGERIVTVEDVAELRPRHPHVVRLVCRPANIEGAGGVELRDLVRQALRMRPDRLVVGEVRGAEVCELLAALNTGHDGGAGTLHANSAQEVPARMEALASTGGLTRAALHSQLAAAVQVVLHMRRLPTGHRVLDAVGVLTAAEHGIVRPVWVRGSGLTRQRDELGALLARRGTAVPW